MSNAIAVLNAGSSSLKFSLFVPDGGSLALIASGQAEGLFTSPKFVAKDGDGKVIEQKAWGDGVKLGHEGALDHLVASLRVHFKGHRLAAVGHRVVHGGPEYSRPTRVTPAIVDALEKYVPLAPLHQPHNLSPIRLLLSRDPSLPQVDARAAAGRTVVLHLGNGASMCAMRGGRSMASTMGFTAADGLPMGTRCGNLDPGVVLYLMQELRMDTQSIEKLIYQESGLLGVSGISSDMRTLEASADPAAKAAIDLFAYRIGRELGSLAAALGGLDAIVFTAGIGEHSVSLRERVCRDAAWLGVELDPVANASGGPRITTAGSRTAAWVVPTNEELMIARHTAAVLGGEIS